MILHRSSTGHTLVIYYSLSPHNLEPLISRSLSNSRIFQNRVRTVKSQSMDSVFFFNLHKDEIYKIPSLDPSRKNSE